MLYREIIPQVVDVLLKHTNTINQGIEIQDPMELASAQRFIGKELSRSISESAGITNKEATKIVDIIHGHRSKIIKHRGKKKKKYIPMGVSSNTILEYISIRSKFGKDFSPKWLSSVILPEMERWGYVESHKEGNHIKTYRVNGYL